MKIYLDTRRQLDNGEYPLKLQIAFNKSQAMYNTGLRIQEQYWDATTQKVVKHSRKDFLNMRIHEFLNAAEDIKYELSREGSAYTPTDIKKRLVQMFESAAVVEKYTLQSAFDDKRSIMNGSSLRKYDCVLQHIKEYDASVLDKRLEDITKPWVLNFYKELCTKVGLNTARAYVNAIKAVYNNAIDNGKTNAYPFRGVKMRSKETVKRSLNIAELRSLFKMKSKSFGRQYMIDMFKLIFLLRGINVADLMKLTSIDSNGYIDYYRSKTGTLYNVKVEPEAMDIINKYRGDKYLVDIAERFTNELSFLGTFKYHFKKIFTDRVVTTYWARHSWATTAAELDISDEVIGMGLGHKPTLKITNIYINRNQKKVDDANRKIIDYVLGNEIT